MTATVKHDADGAMKISLSPSWITIAFSVMTAIVAVSIWIQSELSERPTRAETKGLVKEGIEAETKAVQAKLDAQAAMLQRIYDKIEKR